MAPEGGERNKVATHPEHAETDGDEGEAGDTGAPATSVLVHEREGAEEGVCDTVRESAEEPGLMADCIHGRNPAKCAVSAE